MVHGSWTAGDWRVRQAKVCVAGRGCTAGVCFFARPAVASPLFNVETSLFACGALVCAAPRKTCVRERGRGTQS